MLASYKSKLSKDEFINQITHFPGMILGLIFLIVLVDKGSETSAVHLLSYIIYAFTYILVFSASTIYHSQICEKRKELFKKIDHASIYIFMAGCYTPFVVINMTGPYKWPFLIFVWSMAVFGVLYKFYSAYKRRLYSTVLYFIFGYMCFFAKSDLLEQIPPLSYDLLVYGGLFYSVGAIFYTLKEIPYHHGIWHIFVVVGSSLHFMAIYLTY